MPKKIPAKNTIKKIDWSGTGRGPMRVPTRVTAQPGRALVKKPLTGGPAVTSYKPKSTKGRKKK